MLKLLVIIFAFVGLVGCEQRVVTNTTRVTMEVMAVHLKSKKRSKVDLRIVGTSVIYKDQRLYCKKTKAAKVRIGSKWDVVVEDYRQGNRYGSDLKGVDAICVLSQ